MFQREPERKHYLDVAHDPKLVYEVNELLGSSPFSDVSFLLKMCRHAQNYMKFGDKSVCGCCKDTPSRKSARKQRRVGEPYSVTAAGGSRGGWERRRRSSEVLLEEVQ